MAKKKGKANKGKKVTLKMAQNCVECTLNGKRRLDLSYKQVGAVPKCILKLFDVDEMSLARNLLRKIPDFIEQFIKLNELDLHSNYLEEIPAAIGRLQTLEILNLCNNRLRSVPEEIGQLCNLHTLYLGLNQLENLPHTVGKLKELRTIGLSDNRFLRVPGCLGRLGKLQKVNLKRNPMGAIEALDKESLVFSEGFYLVKESFICEDCLAKCKSQSLVADNDEEEDEPQTTDK